jgi:hypothetical protein
MKIRIYQALETLFSAIAKRAEQARQAVAICPYCGRNQYTGPPCVKY